MSGDQRGTPVYIKLRRSRLVDRCQALRGTECGFKATRLAQPIPSGQEKSWTSSSKAARTGDALGGEGYGEGVGVCMDILLPAGFRVTLVFPGGAAILMYILRRNAPSV